MWKSCCATGKRGFPADNGLSMAGVLEMSSLISELFSLLLLQEPSVSLLRLMDSVGSLVFSANIYMHVPIIILISYILLLGSDHMIYISNLELKFMSKLINEC